MRARRIDAFMLIAFHKPYGVVSQFTPDGSPHRPLAAFHFPPDVYPIGRLDADSEGLLLLSDEPSWNEMLLHPRHGHARLYWVQVERAPEAEALRRLAQGVVIQGRPTKPCRVWLLDPQPVLPPRDPPIRFRQRVPSLLAGNAVGRGEESPGAAHDGGGGASHAAVDPRSDRAIGVGRSHPGTWKVLTAEQRDQVALTRPRPFPRADG